jgi:sarcosine oxidase
MMKTNYDYIVLGVGGIGSGALYWLSRRAGQDVLGLEQFELFHARGSSQDYSRIIRLTYHHRDYARLAPHSFSTWATIEEESAVRIVVKAGLLHFAPTSSVWRREIDLHAAAMDETGISYDRLNADEIMRRWPQFRLREDVDGYYQAEGGLADPSKGNAAHVGLARGHGATILDRCPVTAIRPFGGGVEVETGRGAFACRRLIVTAGAWTDYVLAGLGVNLGITVTQEQVTYFATPNLKEFSVGRFPVFMWNGDEFYYGFPIHGEVATKAAIDPAGPVVTPDTRTFDPDPEREQRIEAWLRETIPGFLGPKLYTKTCLYDMPRDRNFIIDALPQYPQILVCSGAAHGFKFASLFGKMLSEMAIDGQTDYPIEPFTLQRPAITDPNYPKKFR